MYRIKEYNGRFEIEVKVIISQGILWWRREWTDWVPVDIYGNPIYFDDGDGFISTILHSNRPARYSESTCFSTLEEAKRFLQKIKERPKYHY